LKNLLKKTDIFCCNHNSHRGFKKKMSVYHILKEKKCYPEGCFYYQWQCKLLSKKHKCHRGYKQVGRNCFNCRYFYEQKIHNIPELQITQEKFQLFLKELDQFEDWLIENQYKDLEIEGIVSGVKPHFVRKIYPKTDYLSFKGYILIFKELFIGRYHMDDYVYGLISSNLYSKLNFGRGDKIEAIAQLSTQQGRLLLNRFRRVNFLQRGEPALWDEQKAIIAKETATLFSIQPESCVKCPFGALVDVMYMKDHRSYSNRELFCLKGQKDYKNCYLRVEYCGSDTESQSISLEFCSPSGTVFTP
jgi:hypothetical protein